MIATEVTVADPLAVEINLLLDKSEHTIMLDKSEYIKSYR